MYCMEICIYCNNNLSDLQTLIIKQKTLNLDSEDIKLTFLVFFDTIIYRATNSVTVFRTDHSK